MSQPPSLLAGSALGRQTCFIKYNINLSACSAPGRQTCRLTHEELGFYLAIGTYRTLVLNSSAGVRIRLTIAHIIRFYQQQLMGNYKDLRS
jgi:hypothetical protein